MSTPPPERTTAYGPDPAQVYDVRRPTTTHTGTTVVVVHGGFWKAEWDRTHAAAQSQALADAGHHVAVVEYRRTGMPGGGWPGTVTDVRAAVAAVAADPALPDRLVLVGHSAGGHLVALVAAAPPVDLVVGAVVLAGVVDLALAGRLDLGAGAAQAFLGNATPGDWEAADPAAHPPRVPLVLVQGDADTSVPLEVAQSYRARLAGREQAYLDLRVLAGVDHDELIEPAHPAFVVTLESIAQVTGQ